MTNRHFDRLHAKLTDQRGDSMVEALTAILIAVLGATMLATMVMASVNVSTTSQRTLNASYTDETALFSKEKTLTDITVNIPADGGGSGATEANPTVTLYRSGDYEYYVEGKHV